MTSHYRVFPRALTLKECQTICKLAASLGSKPGDIGFGGKTIVNQSIRKSDVCWLPRVDPDLQWLWNKIEFYTHKANTENFDCIDARNFADVQFTTYKGDEQGHYGPHQDNTFITTDGRNWDRKLSVCIQLSEPGMNAVVEPRPKKKKGQKKSQKNAPKTDSLTRYEGGEFWVNPSRPFQVTDFKDAGDLIVFPSLLWHEVKPVTSGTRHSLVTWFNGPRWR